MDEEGEVKIRIGREEIKEEERGGGRGVAGLPPPPPEPT